MQQDHETVYRINEIFYSIEGEGGRVGQPTVFVRLSGCNLQCPWCDAAQHPHVHFRFTAESLVDYIHAQGWPGRWVCLTGGEPMLQDAPGLCLSLQKARYRVHLETNGTYPIPPHVFDWVTISPKMQQDVAHDRYPFLPANEGVATEFKYVVSVPEDIDLVRWGETVFLQPNSTAPGADRLCVDAVLRHPHWRISLQVNKILGLP